ncbi:MAG: tryptophan synthase subunit alpha [Candidatus Paceibacterota bacterium]|jgi:tryptophan synthase alpha chain
MKNKIDIVIEKIKERKRIGVMAHLVTGYPTFSLSKRIAKALVKGGANIIEIQIPFSDPMADGTLIVEACQKSLDAGTRIKDSFELAKFVSKNLKTPVVLMTYANILIHMGIERFCVACKDSGVSGLIVPDLPYDTEECKTLQNYATKARVHLIYVISPAIEDNRLQEIKKLASGFIYCTSRQGTTGTGKKFAKDISLYLERVRGGSSIPLAVGFGISSSKDLKLIKRYSEIGIIGSAIIDVIRKSKNSEIVSEANKFMYKVIK